ncbi:MAG: hemolysin family protein, partial [Verrucomicrobia bacterium]|nr:hemolysin family protein [Verrucomicrobiota bacterium]
MTGLELIGVSLKILAAGVLVLLNGFFVAAEFAIVKVRETQLDMLVQRGKKSAATAKELVRNLDAYLSATQLGITLASLGLGWIGEPVFVTILKPIMSWMGVNSMHLQESIAFVVGFSTITFLHIVVGELAPKSMAIQRTIPVTLFVSKPLHLFYIVSYPFIWMLNHSAWWLLRQIGLDMSSETEAHHSEDELRLLLAASQKKLGGTNFGRHLVLGAFDLKRRMAREILRPRRQIVFFDTNDSIEECIEIAQRTRYSRFPLCEDGDLDRIIGIIHIKDLYAVRGGLETGKDLAPLALKTINVPETAQLERLLRRLQEKKLHVAIVVDEFGGTLGMITLENILEELVGSIQDEFDDEEPLVRRLNENTWILSGALSLRRLYYILGWRFPDTEITTVNGFVTQRLKGFPKAGDVIDLGQHKLTVEETEGLRVSKLKLTK